MRLRLKFRGSLKQQRSRWGGEGEEGGRGEKGGGGGFLTTSACFWAVLLKPLRESLRQAANWARDSALGCHAMMGGGGRKVIEFEFEGR